MNAARRLFRKPIDQLRESPLAANIDAFERYLHERHYASQTLGTYIGGLAHFARWMSQRQLDAEHLDEDTIARFLDVHLPQCRCAELRRFDEHMDHVRGLAGTTRTLYLRTVRRLLHEQFGEGRVVAPAITPDDVRRFVARQSGFCRTPGGAATMISALRGYLSIGALATSRCGRPKAAAKIVCRCRRRPAAPLPITSRSNDRRAPAGRCSSCVASPPVIVPSVPTSWAKRSAKPMPAPDYPTPALTCCDTIPSSGLLPGYWIFPAFTGT